MNKSKEVTKIEKQLLSFKESVLEYPFGPEVKVFKIRGKMFALLAKRDDGKLYVNLKCDPADAHILRDLYPGVTPGYHMNKLHWNSIVIDGSVPENAFKKMMEESYRLVVSKMKKKDREELL